MKGYAGRSLKFTAAYLGIVLAGLFLCASVYMVYSLCTGMVAGEQIKFIDGYFFLHGALFSAPLVFIAAGIFSILYFMRHPDDSKIAVIFFLIFYSASWIFAVPAAIKYNETLENRGHTFVKSELSTGYFRNKGHAVVYFSSINDGKGEGVVIRKGSINYIKDFPVTRAGEEFADSIIENNIKMEDSMSEIVNLYKKFYSTAKKEADSGFLSWICFASIAAVLISAVSLRRVSKWRLLNVMTIIVLYLAEIFVHKLFYAAEFLKPSRAFLSNILPFIPGNTLALCANLILCGFIFAVGIIITKFKRRQR